MTTQYTPILKIALPVTGELSGTWGDVVNDNITSMFEQAIAGLATINTWTANAHTLTSADGTTSESRCAMLVAADGAGLSAAGEIICPAASKLYVLKNGSSYALTLKTSGGSGVAVAAGETAFLFCDGTNVNACVTTIVDGHITGNLTVDGNATINGNTTLGNATSDTITATARFASGLTPSADNTYDLGSTGNSWKDLYIDGTAYLALVDINGGTIDGVSIGATTPATVINVDNLRLDGNTLSSTDTNGNVVIAPNGTGDVQLDADTVRVGDSGAAATLTSNGAGALTVTTGGAANLTLSTNSGTDSGTITIANGANGNITLTPNGTGDVALAADTTILGDTNTDTYLTTNGTGNLNLTTNGGTNSGVIQIAQGANGNITLTPNGTGSVSVPKLVVSTATATRVPYISTGGLVVDSANLTFNGTDLTVSGAVNAGSVNATTLDLTNLEVTNIKAKDGTASITLADSTGVASFTANPVLSGGTANGVAYLNGSKVLTTGSALSFDASTLLVNAANVSYRGQISLQGGASDFSQITFYRGATTDTNQVGYVHSINNSGSSQSMVIGARNGAFLKFDVGDAESARITSTYKTLLVGTSTEVSDANLKIQLNVTASDTQRYFAINNNGNYGLVMGFTYNDQGNIRTVSNYPLTFGTNNIERGRFDTSGNLLVNTTNNYAVGATGYVMAKSGYVFAADNTGSANNRNWLIGLNGSAPGSLDFVDSSANNTWPNNAYRMSLTSAGQLLLGATSLASGFSGIAQIEASGTNGGIIINSSSTGASDYSRLIFTKGNANGNEGLIRYNTNDYHMAFWTNATEKVRITSGGLVLIGTTSTTETGQLYVNGAKTISSGIPLNQIGAADSSALAAGVGGAINFIGVYTSGGAQTSFASIEASKDNATSGQFGASMIFKTRVDGGAQIERLRVTSTGNAGLGVTPSDWLWPDGSTGVLQLQAGAAFSGYNAGAVMSQNWYYNANERFIGNGWATRYSQASGVHSWSSSTASNSSGAGAVLTWAESMRITTAGRIAMGSSSTPQGRLGVWGLTGGSIELSLDSNPNYGEIQTYSSSPLYLQRQGNSLIVNSGGGAFMVGLTNGENKANINESGSAFSAPTLPPGLTLYSNGAGNGTGTAVTFKDGPGPQGIAGIGSFRTGGAGGYARDLRFYANNVATTNGYQEVARFDENGNLLIGTTTTSPSSGSFATIKAGYSITSTPMTVANQMSIWDNTSSAMATYFLEFRQNSTAKGYIQVTSSAVSYVNLSDYRLKENIKPMTGALARVTALKPCTYTMKADGSASEGFIAHELAEVCPIAVTGEKDAVDKDGNPKYQGVDTGFMVAMLTAAIQELKAEFDTYKATHP